MKGPKMSGKATKKAKASPGKRAALPCVAVPTGVRNNVPLGVQLVAGRFREDRVSKQQNALKAAPVFSPRSTPCRKYRLNRWQQRSILAPAL
jgi:Asp-tRNA(Asn)/Glu-tRNA(Gln) amidotransferase A subunit family amidase